MKNKKEEEEESFHFIIFAIQEKKKWAREKKKQKWTWIRKKNYKFSNKHINFFVKYNNSRLFV